MVESNPRRLSREERLVFRYIGKIEMGDEALIKRIQSTLELDSHSKPSREDIETFVKLQRQKHARGSS